VSNQKLVYLGPPGTFTHAAIDLMTVPWSGEIVAEKEVSDVVFAVESGSADAGLVPLENSVEGDVLSTLDELIFRAAQCFINEEIVVPISFVLAVPSSTKNAPVTKVLTHPHAAAQCKEFIKANKIEVEFTASTADACRIVAERKEAGLGAIAATKGADTFGLFVKQTRLEDFAGGKTRMALISRNLSSPTGHDKTTLVITPVADRNGLLSDILTCFAKRDIGLTSISSRPLKTRLGEYTFMVSARGHIGEPTLQAARVGESLPPGSVTSDVLKEWVERLVKAATEVPR